MIKNADWNENPSEIEFKLNESDTSKKATIKEVKEFGINDISKYIRADTKIDLSTEELSKLNTVRNPIWSDEQLFLKVLVSGKATLYSYNGRSLQRFFYSLSDSTIQQLVYKEYLVDEGGNQDNFKLATNNGYMQQLFLQVRCPETTMSSISTLSYTKSQLVKYFSKYNVCSGAPLANEKPQEVVLIGAHYDSAVGTPGANDNGSGVAALILHGLSRGEVVVTTWRPERCWRPAACRALRRERARTAFQR